MTMQRQCAMDYSDIRNLNAQILLSGVAPTANREMQFSKERLAFKGHRMADITTRPRAGFIRKFLHPANAHGNRCKKG